MRYRGSRLTAASSYAAQFAALPAVLAASAGVIAGPVYTLTRLAHPLPLPHGELPHDGHDPSAVVTATQKTKARPSRGAGAHGAGGPPHVRHTIRAGL